jgi:hypothetical protein
MDFSPEFIPFDNMKRISFKISLGLIYRFDFFSCPVSMRFERSTSFIRRS